MLDYQLSITFPNGSIFYEARHRLNISVTDPEWRRFVVDPSAGERQREFTGHQLADFLAARAEPGPELDRTLAIVRRATFKMTEPGGFPRAWRLFSFILPRATRERVFQPVYQELLIDYLEARRECNTPRSRRWLTFCFGVKTVLMVVGCLRAWARDATVGRLLSFLPASIRQWIQ
jgi:hypothetical protein